MENIKTLTNIKQDNFSIRKISIPKNLTAYLLLSPTIIIITLFLLLPMSWVITNSFICNDNWSLNNYLEIIHSSFYIKAFKNSLSLSFLSAFIGLSIASITCIALKNTNLKIKNSILALTNITSNFAGVPLSFAFIVMFGFNGCFTLFFKEIGLIDSFNLYSSNGLLLIYIYFQIPLAILLLYPAFANLNKSWQEAATLLGASKPIYWLKIALKIIMPSLLGTFIILIANALGAYASAFALMNSNYNLITIRIASLVAGDLYLEPNLAAALAVLLMLLLSAICLINNILLKRNYYAKSKA